MKTRKTKSVKPLTVLTGDRPTLRKIAQAVKNPTTKKFKKFVKQLVKTIKSFGGVGIAAPQVGESLRVIVVASKPTPAYPDAPTMKPTVMVNPSICRRSGRMVMGWEGCGSLPGIRAMVLRYSWVEVTYTNMSGNLCYIGYDGLLARILQHELDHLDGILFTDCADLDTLVSEEEYQLIMAKKKRKQDGLQK